MMIQRRSRTLAVACVLAATATLAVSGCSKSEGSDNNASSDSSQAAQAAKTPESSSGSGCSLQSYGAPKLDLKNAVVGFSQSEKEANPFRIAETQSIKDEAKKLGVKKLLTTNAQSQLPKQISDIQDMLAQGAQFLIIAPLNSDGLEPPSRPPPPRRSRSSPSTASSTPPPARTTWPSWAPTSWSRASVPPTP